MEAFMKKSIYVIFRFIIFSIPRNMHVLYLHKKDYYVRLFLMLCF